MKTPQPPFLATKLLDWLAPGPHGEALASDFIEQYREGRTKAWYRRQVLLGKVICLLKDRTLGGFAVLGSSFVLLLTIGSVGRYPASLGTGPLVVDLGLLSAYSVFSIWNGGSKVPI